MIHGLVLLTMLLAEPAVTSTDGVVTESDGRRITHAMIACGSAYRDRPEACHALEQQRIETRLHRQWIDAARELQGVVLTPLEEADVVQRVSETRSHSEKAAAHFRALAVAALRIRRGEDRAIVASELSRQGIAVQELEWELEQLPTVAAAERTASKDFVADGEKASRDYYTRLYVIDHLWKIVARRAAEQHVSFDAAEEQFWSEVITKTHTRMVDPSYRLPARKGVLFSHEQQTHIAH